MLMYYPFINTDGLATVVATNHWELDDYDQRRFRYDDDGDKIVFYDEEEAVEWLHENIKPDKIESQYASRIQSNDMWDDLLL